MSTPHDAEDAREAEAMGEKPDLGHTPDALRDALSGSDMGSDTRAGSLQGGPSTGSDDDPDQQTVNDSLASEGMTTAAGSDDQQGGGDPTQAVNNTGERFAGDGGDPAEGKRGDKDADAATG